MKKFTLATALILVGLTAPITTALAEESQAKVSLKSGEISITETSDLNFGEITYDSKGGYYYPTIESLYSWMTDVTPYTPQPPEFLGLHVARPERHVAPALVVITNHSINNNGWKLLVSRTPFINSTTQHELKDASLALGNLVDMNYNTGEIAKKEFLEIGVNTTQEVFSASGSTAKGKHLISIFDNAEALEPIGEQKPAPPEFGYATAGPFKVNNAALYIPANADVQPGHYSSSIIWTLSVTL